MTLYKLSYTRGPQAYPHIWRWVYLLGNAIHLQQEITFSCTEPIPTSTGVYLADLHNRPAIITLKYNTRKTHLLYGFCALLNDYQSIKDIKQWIPKT